MTDPIKAAPIGLLPDTGVSISSELLSAQNVVFAAMEKANDVTRRQLERKVRIYEILYRMFLDMRLQLLHEHKNQFFWRIEAFFEEIGRVPETGERFYQSYQIYRLKFELLTFAFSYATNIDERLPFMTRAQQDLHRKIGTSIRILQELQRNTAA